MERLGAPHLLLQLPGEGPRHDPVPGARGRPGAEDLRDARQLRPPRSPPIPISQARRLLREARQADRPLPHHRLGRGHLAPQRGPDRRGHLPRRLRPGLRRPRAHHLQEPRARRLGPVRGRDRDHRPHLPHDVAAHRPQAPHVQEGAGREVRRRHREGLSARRRPRGPAAGQGPEGRRVHGHVRPRLPLLPPRGEPQHLARAERLHGLRGPGGREEGPGRPLRPRPSSSRASTGRGPGPTRWAWARSTST